MEHISNNGAVHSVSTNTIKLGKNATKQNIMKHKNTVTRLQDNIIKDKKNQKRDSNIVQDAVKLAI